MIRREPVVVPSELRPRPEETVTFEQAEERLFQEAEKRKKEWENQMERLRQQLVKSALRQQSRRNQNVQCSVNVQATVRDTLNRRILEERRSRGRLGGDPGTSTGSTEESSPEEAQFCVRFDMSEYLPEHITVQVKGEVLIVQASCEEIKHGARTLKEFSKKSDIPRDVNADDLISRYSSDGVLTVEVPKCPQPSPSCSRENIRQV